MFMWSKRVIALASAVLAIAGCQSSIDLTQLTYALSSDTVGKVANWLGIFGFLVTLRVWWTTRSLSKKFLNIARIPELTRDLVKLDKELLAAVQAGNMQEVGGIASRLSSSLDNASGKIDLSRRWGFWTLRWKLMGIRSGSVVEVVKVRHIHDELLGVIKTLEHIEKDSKWER